MNSNKRTDIWGPWTTLGWGSLIFIVWLVAQSVPVLVIWILLLHQNAGKEAENLLKDVSENGLAVSLSTVASSLVGSGILWLIIIMRKGAKFSDYLGLHSLDWKTLLRVLGVAAGFCLATDLLTYFLGKDIVPAFMIKSYSTCGILEILILGFILLDPLFEEFFFRGFLFEGLRHSSLGNVGAALLISGGWACLHIQYDAYGIANVFAGGLILAYLRLKTGSLWSCIVFHMWINLWGTIETILYFHGFTFLHLSKG